MIEPKVVSETFKLVSSDDLTEEIYVKFEEDMEENYTLVSFIDGVGDLKMVMDEDDFLDLLDKLNEIADDKYE